MIPFLLLYFILFLFCKKSFPMHFGGKSKPTAFLAPFAKWWKWSVFSQICLFGFLPPYQSQPWILLEGFPSSMRISAFERKRNLLVWRTYRSDFFSTCRPSTLQAPHENPHPPPLTLSFLWPLLSNPPTPHTTKRSCLRALSLCSCCSGLQMIWS